MLKKKIIAIIGIGRIGKQLGYSLMNLFKDPDIPLQKIIFIHHDSDNLVAFKKDIQDFIAVNAICSKNTQNIVSINEQFYFTKAYSAVEGADIIICCFGSKLKKTIIDRKEILVENDSINIKISNQIKRYVNKSALILSIVNPLETITWRLQTLTNHPNMRVFGVSGLLDKARFLIAIQEVLNIPVEEIDTDSLYMIGEHGTHLIPVLSQVKISNQFIVEKLSENEKKQIIEKTIYRGVNILKLQGFPPTFGPVSSLLSICKSILLEEKAEVICSVFHPHYHCYLTYPCTLNGMNGITNMKHDLILNNFESESLNKAIKEITHNFYSISQPRKLSV